ncbi:MAG: hypothetical protein KIT14_12930 [bacterium]|nr:hypothetical protein [bacterium]
MTSAAHVDDADPSCAGATVLVDELARAGVRDAVVAPGSRSAPLALACGAHPGLRVWSHVDERAAGFFALGLARATRRPVLVCCTSGTAAANLLPAVVEAFHAGVPLVVCTADRPPELRDAAAPQTIDQVRLFGTHVRWFFELGPLDATAVHLVVYARTVAASLPLVGRPAAPSDRTPYGAAPRRRPAPARRACRRRALRRPRPRRDGPWTRIAPLPDPPDPGAVDGAAAGARRRAARLSRR